MISIVGTVAGTMECTWWNVGQGRMIVGGDMKAGMV